jgi:hypothetical protein
MATAIFGGGGSSHANGKPGVANHSHWAWGWLKLPPRAMGWPDTPRAKMGWLAIPLFFNHK